MVTMNDIAEHLGVSRTTVSYVLNERGKDIGISEVTCKAILRTATELGYRLNTSAKAVRTGWFGTIGLLTSENILYSLFSSSLLSGIQDELIQHDLNLLFSRQSDTALTDKELLPKLLREMSVDGLLINYTVAPPEPLLEIIQRHAIPAIFLNIKQENDCVYPDDFQVGCEAARQLLNLGHRRIGFVDYTASPHYSAADRRAGFLQTMQEAAAEPILYCPDDRVPDDHYAEYSRVWLRRPDRPTAVFTYNSSVAASVIYAAALENVRVPEDLSVITVSDTPPSVPGILLSNIHLPDADMGRLAVKQLLQKIQAPTVTLPGVACGGYFHPGVTTQRI